MGRMALEEGGERAAWLLDFWSNHEIGEFTLPRPRPPVERVDDARQINVQHWTYHPWLLPPVWPFDISASSRSCKKSAASAAEPP